jgi:hypothetical protein
MDHRRAGWRRIFVAEEDGIVGIVDRSRVLFVIVCEGEKTVRPIGARWATVEATFWWKAESRMCMALSSLARDLELHADTRQANCSIALCRSFLINTSTFTSIAVLLLPSVRIRITRTATLVRHIPRAPPPSVCRRTPTLLLNTKPRPTRKAQSTPSQLRLALRRY